MVECPSDFNDLTCIPDHLNAEDRSRAAFLIEEHVRRGDYVQARTWLHKVNETDRSSAKVIANLLMDQLSFIDYQKLFAVPEKDVLAFIAEKALTEEQSFNEWMAKVDSIVERKMGVSVHELPDMNFRDSYEDGVSPEEFVREDLMPEIREEFGYNIGGDYE